MNLQMKPNEYVFNIGDEVITVEGQRGYITYICHCERCAERGFFEPSWCDEQDDMHYISNYVAENGFDHYYKVGSYYFNPFRKDVVTEKIEYYEGIANQLKKQRQLINEMTEAVMN